MSHTRDQRNEWRAISAVAAVCALVFALLVSGAQTGARAEASMRAASRGDMHQAICQHHASDAAQNGTPDGGGRSKRGDCPCCLVGQAGAAVLPERVVTVTRVERTATHALYLPAAAVPPRFAFSQAVNGARAPPFHAIS